MFSFWGSSSDKKEEETKENVSPTGAGLKQPLTSIDEASSKAEAGSVPRTTSSDSAVVVEHADAIPSEATNVSEAKTAVEEKENLVPSSAGGGAKDVTDDEHGGEQEGADADEDNIEDEIDLEQVEHYENTFNEFISKYPHFLINNHDLVHSLRVSKLQKFLEMGDTMENELMQQSESLDTSKAEVEMNLYQLLMDATRKKAAREVHLQSNLSELQYRTKESEAKLKWNLVTNSESRAKNHYKMRQDLKSTTVGEDRRELLALLPQGADFEELRNAVLSPLGREKGDDCRQLQVDNALLNAEITVLTKKLEFQKITAKKNAWVESVLVRMDPKTRSKLKSKHQKKAGVSW